MSVEVIDGTKLDGVKFGTAPGNGCPLRPSLLLAGG